MSKMPRIVSVALAAAIVPAFGCTGSDSSALSADYCNAVKTVFHYDTGLHGEGDPSAIKAAYASALRELGPSFDTVEADGPEGAAGAARALRALYTDSRDEGTDPFDGEAPLLSTVVAASREGCDWSEQQVDASDFAFAAPSSIEAGTVAVRLRNHSDAEPHLFLLMKVKDGVDKPLDELLAQFAGPDIPADADVEFVNGGAFAFPGQTAFGVVDLTPGRYLYLCPIPVDGATSDGDNHMSRGMHGEFEVA